MNYVSLYLFYFTTTYKKLYFSINEKDFLLSSAGIAFCKGPFEGLLNREFCCFFFLQRFTLFLLYICNVCKYLYINLNFTYLTEDLNVKQTVYSLCITN